MIERIVQDPQLSLLVCDECAENEVSVTFDGTIDRSDYVILKVDDYYNSLNIEKRPPAPDCLIVLKCREKGHALAVVELKNIHTGSSLPLDNLIAKFETCFDDFISNQFKAILDQDYQRIQLIFVSNIELYKRDIGLKVKALMDYRLQFRGKRYAITPYMPTPNIKACY